MSYKSEIFSWKWDLPNCSHPPSITPLFPGKREQSRQKNSHFNRTPLLILISPKAVFSIYLGELIQKCMSLKDVLPSGFWWPFFALLLSIHSYPVDRSTEQNTFSPDKGISPLCHFLKPIAIQIRQKSLKVFCLLLPPMLSFSHFYCFAKKD